jgi:glycosyltransferase involved in cell wall biosynthesis
MEVGKKILFVFSELPFPARLNGISVRYAPIITDLARRHEVHVALIVRPDEARYPEGLDEICESVQVFRRGQPVVGIGQKIATRLVKCISSDVPYPLYSYDNGAIEGFLRQIAQQRNHDLVVWVGSMHLEIGIRVFGEGQIVHDAIDSLYHAHLRNRQRSLFHALDGRKIADWERYLVSATKCTSFVSQVDAALFNADAALEKKVMVFPNGVFLGDFTAQTRVDAEPGVITLGFLGHMGYRPNIEAAQRLCAIYKLIKERAPDFRLLIIGRDPADEVRALGEIDGVTVTGSVDNIWDYIAKVDAFVFPMVSGAGQQNKVLEAMYGGKVVVCNTLANSGIGATDGEHLLVCETDAEFADAILALKTDSPAMKRVADSGRTFVSDRYSWEKIIPMIEKFWLSA